MAAALKRPEAMTTFDIELRLLLDAIHLRYQHDFRAYSIASMRRRMDRALQDLGFDSLSRLQHYVLREPATFARLMQYLTVQVSEMFRDPEYFRQLREKVVPLLKTYPSVKVWVAGCSTGEELWSLAILFHEEDLSERTIFYATDINPEALRMAKSGVYAIERLAGFSANYLAAGGTGSLSDYYHADYGGAHFARHLIERAVFAEHSLATDSVFSEVHLVSCRNVLIYFNRELQDRAVGLFDEALVRRGFLGLGSQESLRFCAHADAFGPLAAKERIYQKV
ncbi:protein-glutamate O-methyltransferase CheR [Verticiella sediminum]|uniref:Protein-glutamate O-methyltransferase CheR n=1 Tax=Verticiella sediminum TaxID=1247510 RepID=A0A556AZL1_9BURK|nr:CheR family methyltransferase [Verticiella sediminum]TSH97885.1 protein-glutamate O-methyltransferase CheR [Verticiella sediminum]